MEKLDRFETYSGFTGERVKYVRKSCVCGHSITFLSNKPTICRHCARTVYPTKECEFKEKLKKEIKKNK